MTTVARKIVLLGWLLCLYPFSAVAEKSFAEHYREAVGAYRSGDAKLFETAARSARALRPDSPSAAYLLAAALATAGQSEESLELLGLLASQGLQFTPAEEPAFASLDLENKAPALLKQLDVNGAPAGETLMTFNLDDGRFVPEGIAWDESRERFLLGSVPQWRIVTVGMDGKVEDFVTPGQHGLLSVFGMQVDPASDSLWLVTSGLKEGSGTPQDWLGRAGILQFSLEDAQLIRLLAPEELFAERDIALLEYRKDLRLNPLPPRRLSVLLYPFHCSKSHSHRN